MHARRSPFISALAWVLIVLSALTGMIVAFQAWVVTAMFDAELLQYVLDDLEPEPAVAIDGATLLRVMQLYVYSLLALCAVSLAAAVGLLKRHEWARMFWIVMLAIGAVLHVAGAVVPFITDMPWPQALPTAAVTVTRVLLASTAVVFAVLYAWLVKRLLEPGVAVEFRS